MMKYYFYENIVLGFEGEDLPQGFPLVNSFSERVHGCFPLTQEQTDYYLANLNESVLSVYYCGNIPQGEPILPTLEERKNELIEKFKPVQDIFTNRLTKVSNILGENHDYILRLKNICRFRREQTLETILSFTTIEQAMVFDIRESDMQPILSIMDIVENNPLSNTQAIDYVGQAITQIEQYFGIV